jgi:hypothetical protein
LLQASTGLFFGQDPGKGFLELPGDRGAADHMAAERMLKLLAVVTELIRRQGMYRVRGHADGSRFASRGVLTIGIHGATSRGT